MKICLVALLPNRRRVETLPIERKQKGLITRDLPSVHCIFWGQRPPPRAPANVEVDLRQPYRGCMWWVGGG